MGAATSTIFCCDKQVFVATKHVFCLDKSMLAATKLLSRQNHVCSTIYFCHAFVATNDVFCCDKHVFVATQANLSRQNLCGAFVAHLNLRANTRQLWSFPLNCPLKWFKAVYGLVGWLYSRRRRVTLGFSATAKAGHKCLN